ncbi:MAG TPA: tetratricopeptide repeat protein, partial [Acidobacteriota bacterium]|nr:tetratricopeptide repeat protein [Acidobacteriota bacterium]
GLAGTLAEVYVGLNKPEKGLGYIEKALARDPFREDYWLTRGKLLEANGQVEGAKSAYRRSIALAPELIESRFGLAQLAFRQQKYAEIESILHRDNELYPNLVPSASALNLLAAAYQNQGKPLLALATMIEVVQKEDNPEYWITLARFQIALHRDPRESINRALACDPNQRQLLEADQVFAPYLEPKKLS